MAIRIVKEVVIETGNSGNLIDVGIELPLSTAATACSANSACSGLSGDCCPTTSGARLGCCDIIETTDDADTTVLATTGIPTATRTSPPSADTSVAIEEEKEDDDGSNNVDDTQNRSPQRCTCCRHWCSKRDTRCPQPVMVTMVTMKKTLVIIVHPVVTIK